MRQYELMIIIHPDEAGDDHTRFVETIENWVKSSGGQIARVDDWGSRRLAYPIRHQREGKYLLFQLMLPPAAVAELEHNLRLSEPILRYLIVRDDG